MTQRELNEIAEVLKKLAEAVAERINDLEDRVKRLEAEPRESFAAKLRNRK